MRHESHLYTRITSRIAVQPAVTSWTSVLESNFLIVGMRVSHFSGKSCDTTALNVLESWTEMDLEGADMMSWKMEDLRASRSD